MTATATVVDPPFTLVRRIVTTVGQGLVRLDDRVVNDSDWTAAAPLLYHVNIGAPLWDDDAYLETDAHEVVPRDAAAAAGLADVGRAAGSGRRTRPSASSSTSVPRGRGSRARGSASS